MRRRQDRRGKPALVTVSPANESLERGDFRVAEAVRAAGTAGAAAAEPASPGQRAAVPGTDYPAAADAATARGIR
jgi:hypothetical protein